MCCKQYEKVLAILTDDSLPRSTIKEYTSQSLQYSIQQKRKLDKITSEDYLSEDQDLNKPIEIEDALHEHMNFVETFNIIDLFGQPQPNAKIRRCRAKL